MRILVTGGNGSLGRAVVPALVARGHAVTVLDRATGALPPLAGLTVVRGEVQDRAAVEEAIRGAEAVIHLAWSFSEEPSALLQEDLRGHQLLLEAARAQRVRHLVYASSAVVYGKPAHLPIDEDHPLRVLEARKPAYGIAKELAEKLTLLAARSGGPPATIVRFWWAFGDGIGGRHLEDMLRTAAAGRRLAVPAESGGSFLTVEDLVEALALLLASEPRGGGDVFNLASAYVSWEEVAPMVIAATGASAGFDVVAADAWKGPAFLADVWNLDVRRIQEQLGWRPLRDAAAVRGALAKAIERTWREMA